VDGGDQVAGGGSSVGFLFAPTAMPTVIGGAPIQQSLANIQLHTAPNSTTPATFSGTVDVNLANSVSVTVPVTARIAPSATFAGAPLQLFIFDATHLLSESGILHLAYDPAGQRSDNSTVNRWFVADDQSARVLLTSYVEVQSLEQGAESTPVAPLPVTGFGTMRLRNMADESVEDAVPIYFDLKPIAAADAPACTSDASCPGGQRCDISGFCAGFETSYVDRGQSPHPKAIPESLSFNSWVTANGVVTPQTDPSSVWCASRGGGFSAGFAGLAETVGTRPLSSVDLPCMYLVNPQDRPFTVRSADWRLTGVGPFPFAQRNDVESTGVVCPDNSSTLGCGQHLSTSQLFDACWNELGRVPGAEPSSGSTKFDDFAPSIFKFPAQCVSLGAFAKYMGLASTLPAAQLPKA
jgi:hypothetical protein